MKRISLVASVVALVAAVAAGWMLPAVASAVTPPTSRVVVVLAPYLNWEDITPTSTPTLWRMAQTGAIGDINAKSRLREPGDSKTPLEGGLTISAGAWAATAISAPAAYVVDESYEVGTAAEAFKRTTGNDPGSSRIVYLGLPMTERVNFDRYPELVLGTLGQAIEDAGGATAAIGNSDSGYMTSDLVKVRPAALAAMDRNGTVLYGDVSRDILHEDPDAPFGIETDLVAFDREFARVDKQLLAHGGPALVVLDPGDSYRANKFAPEVADSIIANQRERSLKAIDGVAELAQKRAGKDGVVMVVSLSLGSSVSAVPEGLGPMIVTGSGWNGYLVSSSTMRPGLVTNPDVSATIMSALGVKQPVQVSGNGMTVSATSDDFARRLDTLKKMNQTAVAIDSAKAYIVNTFVVATVIILLLSTIVLVRSRLWGSKSVRWWVIGLRSVLLLVLSVPAASWLMFAIDARPQSQGASIGVFLTALAIMWAVALVVAARAPLRVPIAAVSLLTTVIILADQWLGAPLSFTNFFGYSPLLAARFYGLGNEAAAVLVGSSITGLALLFDQWPDSKWTRIGKRYGIPVVGALVVVTAAAPFLGANVGVAIWGIVGFIVAWVLMNGHHVSWKTVFWMFFAVAAVIAAFAAVDLFGGGAQTHLGRALTSAEQGGFIELWNIIARKAATNTRVLTRTNWAYILVAVLAFLGFMRWRPQGDFAETLKDSPDFADAITVSLAAGVVAYFTEDSGIVIPALIVLYVGVGIVWLMVSRLTSDAEKTGEAAR